MRNFLFTVVMMLAISRVALAISWQSVPCDSTSFVFFLGSDAAVSDAFHPYWEDLALEEERGSKASISTGTEIPDAAIPKAGPKRILFSLPDNFLSAPNPEYQTVKHDKLDFYVKLRRDATSPIYMCDDVNRLTRRDSLTMFLPFDTRNINDYTVKQFGIRAKYVGLRKPLPPHFHIELSGDPVREQFPWTLIFPVVLGIVLVLLALFFQEGYIRRMMNVAIYHNAFQHRVRERNVNADKSGSMLYVNYLVNASLFAIVALYRYDVQFQLDIILVFVLLVLLVLAIYAVKSSISFALAHLFDCRDVFESYYRNVSYLMQVTGVFLLVMNILSFYISKQGIHDFVFYATLVGCAVAEFLKIFRLIKIILDKHFSYFYLFLYLCAVEILPVLLAVKILSH